MLCVVVAESPGWLMINYRRLSAGQQKESCSAIFGSLIFSFLETLRERKQKHKGTFHFINSLKVSPQSYFHFILLTLNCSFAAGVAARCDSPGAARWRGLCRPMQEVRNSCPRSSEPLFTLLQQRVSEQLRWETQRFPLQTHTLSLWTPAQAHTALGARRCQANCEVRKY